MNGVRSTNFRAQVSSSVDSKIFHLSISNRNDSRQRTQRSSTGCVNVPFAQSAPSEIPTSRA